MAKAGKSRRSQRRCHDGSREENAKVGKESVVLDVPVVRSTSGRINAIETHSCGLVGRLTHWIAYWTGCGILCHEESRYEKK